MLRRVMKTRVSGLLIGWTVMSGGWLLGDSVGAQEASRLNWPSRIMDTSRVGEVSPVATGVAIRPGLAEVAVVGDDHVVRIVNASDGRLLRTLPGHQDWIRTIAFAPDGQTLVTAGSDRRILRWDLAQERWSLFASQAASIEGIAFSADGDLLAAVGFEPTLRLYDARTGQTRVELPCPCSDLRAVAFSADGRYLAAGGRSGQLLVWERRGEAWQAVTVGPTHQQRIQAVEFLPGGHLISIGEDRQVVLTELGQASRSHVIATLPAKLYSLAVLSPTVIAVGGSHNRITVIDIEQKTKIGYLEGHRGTVSGLAFRNGRLISGSYDGETRVWQADAAVTVALRTGAGETGLGATGLGATGLGESSLGGSRGLSPGVAFDLPALQRAAASESLGAERVGRATAPQPPLLPIRAVR